jgi:hypothetical protein
LLSARTPYRPQPRASALPRRGFFWPPESLGDLIAALAAIEAVIGLLVEISFIATFIQRYFGNR